MDVQAKEMRDKVNEGLLDIEDVEKDPTSAYILLTSGTDRQVKIDASQDDIKKAIPGYSEKTVSRVVGKIIKETYGNPTKIAEILRDEKDRATVLVLCTVAVKGYVERVMADGMERMVPPEVLAKVKKLAEGMAKSEEK